ncbi:MAG: carbohydrate ABC transporter permease [Propionibacteriaceae bacterium]|jgi:multiple sugar transport system permease protein|nr:carbohydrate ABC transporter permease [Propionibacteriaceae bacterium]
MTSPTRTRQIGRLVWYILSVLLAAWIASGLAWQALGPWYLFAALVVAWVVLGWHQTSRKLRKRLRRVVLYGLASLILVWTIAPFAWLVIASVSTKADLIAKPLRWLPAKPTLQNYRDMLFGTAGRTTDAASQFMGAFTNSLIITITVVIIALMVGLLASYAYSRFRFRGHSGLLNLTLFTQMIPAVVLIIPLYIVFRQVGLLDTKAGLIITYLSFVLPYLVWILKGYIDGIPTDLEEAAMIDGCGRLGAFVRVVLPVAATGLAATVIFAFILAWNEFFFAMNFTQTLASKTLPVVLTEFSSKFGPNFVLAATAGVLASLPPVLVALIFQKYIITGLSAGALKG